jgi:membrane-associated protein
VPSIDKYLLPVIAVIVLVSVLPVAWELYKARKESQGGPSDEAPILGDEVPVDQD